MKKQILWVVLAVFVVSLAVTFSFSGCAKKEEPAPAKVEKAEEVKEAALTKELKIGYVSMMMAADSKARA